MKVELTQEQRKALLDAGIPRQTIHKWLTGTVPRAGNRTLWKIILGVDYPEKGKRGNGRKKQ